MVSMRLRTSPALRATRALAGLVTVWCLGCAGYEQLLNPLVGGDVASMSCATAMSGDHIQLSVSATSTHEGFDCGCGGMCHALSPAPVVAPGAHTAVPMIAVRAPTAPVGVTRVPLLPPPERAA